MSTAAAGAEISEDLRSGGGHLRRQGDPGRTCFEKNKTYVFFSHTIKGQAYNMPMLKDHGRPGLQPDRLRARAQ